MNRDEFRALLRWGKVRVVDFHNYPGQARQCSVELYSHGDVCQHMTIPAEWVTAELPKLGGAEQQNLSRDTRESDA